MKYLTGFSAIVILLNYLVSANLAGNLTLAEFSAELAYSPETQQPADPSPFEQARFNQKLGEQAPLQTSFLNEAGEQVLLGRYFGQKPVILVLAYYECPMLCTLVLNGLTSTLKELEYSAGKDFQVVVVSIDPRETPELARDKKTAYLAEYSRPGSEAGWVFLTGEEGEINTLADAIGFEYVYDETLDQYAHPAGVTLLTPSGKISRYFFGIEFPPLDFRLGLIETSEEKIGSLVDQVYLLCYVYDPDSGKYALEILALLRIAGIGTVLVMGGGILLLVQRERWGKQKVDEVSE
jgi:protein SCO1